MQPPHQQANSDATDNDGLVKSVDSMCMEDVEKISDEELFKQPPTEDCPICFLRMPKLNPTGSKYQTCCGKMICSGCIHAVAKMGGHPLCSFCRTPNPKTNEVADTREKKRMGLDDPIAIRNLGVYHREGLFGFSQDYEKAFKLLVRASELGFAEASCCVGFAYEKGQGVEVDKKKAQHYWEIAAIGGDEVARNNLGTHEFRAGNIERALKHYMLAVGSGQATSLDTVKDMYEYGHATKEDYTKALRSYQVYLGEIKSPQRDEAAAFSDEYRYY